MRRGIHLFAILNLVLVALAPPVAGQETVPLPVRKVVLYKNGMGYFEHVGAIRGRQTVEIVLPSAQLNDVLKSLTVIDLGRGQVTGVTYDSTAPLGRRLRELPIDLNKAGGLVGFLNQIRGTEVEIRAPGGTVRGKIMGAELRTRSTGPGATVQVVEVGIFTAAGELRLVDLESAGALRLTESALAGDVRPLPRPGQFRPPARRAPARHPHSGLGAARPLRQLHLRGPHLEDHLPRRARPQAEAAAARLGHR